MSRSTPSPRLRLALLFKFFSPSRGLSCLEDALTNDHGPELVRDTELLAGRGVVLDRHAPGALPRVLEELLGGLRKAPKTMTAQDG